jgi:hypothetical protein
MVSLVSALEESVTDVTPQREDMGSKAFFVVDSLSSQKSQVVFNQRLALCRGPNLVLLNVGITTPFFSCSFDVTVNHSRPSCRVLLKLMKLSLLLS